MGAVFCRVKYLLRRCLDAYGTVIFIKRILGLRVPGTVPQETSAPTYAPMVATPNACKIPLDESSSQEDDKTINMSYVKSNADVRQAPVS